MIIHVHYTYKNDLYICYLDKQAFESIPETTRNTMDFGGIITEFLIPKFRPSKEGSLLSSKNTNILPFSSINLEVNPPHLSGVKRY